MKSYIADIHRLEASNMELKSKLNRAETEAAKFTLENQKLMQVSGRIHRKSPVSLNNRITK